MRNSKNRLNAVHVLCITLFAVAAFGSAARYFPPGSFSAHAAIDQMKVKWYSDKLTALHEDSLWAFSQRRPSPEAYRFLWLRTFHHPVSVRINITPGGAGVLEAKETNGYGGFPGSATLIRDDKRTLTESDVHRFFSKLERLQIWMSRSKADIGGADGAQWVLEGAKEGRYTILDVWSPGISAPMRDLGLTVLALAQIKVPSDEVY